MKTSALLLFSITIIFSVKPINGFATRSGLDISSLVSSTEDDATTLTPSLLHSLVTSHKITSGASEDFDPLQTPCFITCLSDLELPIRLESKPLSAEQYFSYASDRHADCIELFDRYATNMKRCAQISSTKTTTSLVEEYNIRWEASWISASSVWLFDLADAIGWEVEKKVPDPSKISSFSWLAVIKVFQNAFQTGTIQLPVFLVEGNSRLKIVRKEEGASNMESPVSISIAESIDLVKEADSSRLQNRRVAQELASWLDVSRRPMEMDGKERDWADIVRERILMNVPGAGPLDVDPNEDEPGVILAFGTLCLATFSLLYFFLVGEVVGGTGQVSSLCDDAVKLEVGSGYFSECFGPYGDGPFL